MTTENIRVRFAPSPTGALHIGGVRTALYNYLFARKHGGKIILRIEDTDQSRFVPKAEEYIKESLAWCGIHFDEGIDNKGGYGPYKQSERRNIYRMYVDQLIDNGSAYYAFDTAEELADVRQHFKSKNQTFSYDINTRNELNNSLNMSKEELQIALKSDKPYVVRFKMPKNKEVVFTDIILGKVKVNTNTLDDKVLFKSDGMPTYHLANVIDDHLMEISHVIRGKEWTLSTPLHILLYKALGWSSPLFAHLPLILKPGSTEKLSKRDGQKLGFPVFPMDWIDDKSGDVYMGYKESGYFPAAFINMLAFLGWNPGTNQEIFDMQGLIQAFDLARVGKAGAKFDPAKAKWFNQQYMRLQADNDLADILKAQLMAQGIEVPMEAITQAVALVKERCIFPADLYEQAYFFFQMPKTYNPKVVKKRWKADTPKHIQDIQDILKATTEWTSSVLQTAVKTYIQSRGLSIGIVMNSLRLVIVGDSKGPDLFDIISFIGKENCIKRIEKALKELP